MNKPQKKKPFNIYMDKEFLNEIREYSIEHGVNMSTLIVMLAKNGFKQLKKGKLTVEF